MNKPAYTISDQITLLKQRGMLFRNEIKAYFLLRNISYYRLKGYWWDSQSDTKLHLLQPDTLINGKTSRCGNKIFVMNEYVAVLICNFFYRKCLAIEKNAVLL